MPTNQMWQKDLRIRVQLPEWKTRLTALWVFSASICLHYMEKDKKLF